VKTRTFVSDLAPFGDHLVMNSEVVFLDRLAHENLVSSSRFRYSPVMVRFTSVFIFFRNSDKLDRALYQIRTRNGPVKSSTEGQGGP
jgi:hypothetical protein